MLKRTFCFEREKGSAMVMFALCATVLIGFCALAIDTGLVAYEKSRLGNAADAASLAGAQELIYDRDNACNVARKYLKDNGVDPECADIRLIDGNRISVTANKEVDYFFARIFGLKSTNVSAEGVAKCSPISALNKGVRPFAIEEQSFEYGQSYILKKGGGGGSNGNYGPLELGGNGANNYSNNIANGYTGHLEAGDIVYTETGNMSEPTYQGITELIGKCSRTPGCTYGDYDLDCPRLVTVIIVDSMDLSGRTAVEIKGFASFFLEGVQGQGNDSIITGKFVKTIGIGELNDAQTDYGLKGIKLIQ